MKSEIEWGEGDTKQGRNGYGDVGIQMRRYGHEYGYESEDGYGYESFRYMNAMGRIALHQVARKRNELLVTSHAARRSRDTEAAAEKLASRALKSLTT